jgi:hypothetical protein
MSIPTLRGGLSSDWLLGTWIDGFVFDPTLAKFLDEFKAECALAHIFCSCVLQHCCLDHEFYTQPLPKEYNGFSRKTGKPACSKLPSYELTIIDPTKTVLRTRKEHQNAQLQHPSKL